MGRVRARIREFRGGKIRFSSLGEKSDAQGGAPLRREEAPKEGPSTGGTGER